MHNIFHYHLVFGYSRHPEIPFHIPQAKLSISCHYSDFQLIISSPLWHLRFALQLFSDQAENQVYQTMIECFQGLKGLDLFTSCLLRKKRYVYEYEHVSLDVCVYVFSVHEYEIYLSVTVCIIV